MQLNRLADDKEYDKKHIAVKATNVNDMELEDKECQSKTNENEFMLRKFKEFLKQKQTNVKALEEK